MDWYMETSNLYWSLMLCVLVRPVILLMKLFQLALVVWVNLVRLKIKKVSYKQRILALARLSILKGECVLKWCIEIVTKDCGLWSQIPKNYNAENSHIQEMYTENVFMHIKSNSIFYQAKRKNIYLKSATRDTWLNVPPVILTGFSLVSSEWYLPSL